MGRKGGEQTGVRDARTAATLNQMKFRVLVEQDEDGVFVATCPTLPGCVSQDATRAQALAGAQDAIAGYLASLQKHGEAIPPPIEEEFVEVSA